MIERREKDYTDEELCYEEDPLPPAEPEDWPDVAAPLLPPLLAEETDLSF